MSAASRSAVNLATVVVLALSFSLGKASTRDEPTSPARKPVTGEALPRFERALLLEEAPDESGGVSIGDLNGDGSLDIVLAKGRHSPRLDRVLLNDGHGLFPVAQDLGEAPDRSYSALLVDVDRDGDLDVVISNDTPDPKLVYLNDGKGRFRVGSTYGRPDWPTRNASVADLNGDGLPDIIAANRTEAQGGTNYVCLNRGGGRFDGDCIGFSHESATTIAPADLNGDGFVDLAVPHREGGQSHVYFNDGKAGFAKRVPFGPPDAAIRVVDPADLDNDGRVDLVAIDEAKRGTFVYFNQRDGTFSGGSPVGDTRVTPKREGADDTPGSTPYALRVGDLNLDGKPDVVVGYIEARPAVYVNDGSGRRFTRVAFGDDKGRAYGFAFGDLDKDGRPDIVMARSDAPNVVYLTGGRPAARSPAATAAWVPCNFEAGELSFAGQHVDPGRLRCGHIDVPEDRGRAGDRRIRLAFAVIQAEHVAPGALPLVYLEGGPGAAGLWPYFLALEGPALAVDRDVVVFDQRGTGRSGPSLCPTLGTAERDTVAADLLPAEVIARRRRAQRDCLDELQRQGIDPGAYDMDATVADVEDLRRALGYTRWSLLGRSYGGVLAQRVMRRHPESVHSVILVSPVTPDWSAFDVAVPSAARTLNRIAQDCRADSGCRASFPDMMSEIEGVHRSLHAQPWTVSVDSTEVGSSAFTINAADFMDIVDELLYADWNIPYLPRIVHAFARREPLVAAAVVERVFGGPSRTAIPVRYSVWCRDAVTSQSRERWERAAAGYSEALREIGRLHLDVCQSWPVPPGPAALRRAVKSSIPTLILSGSYDHVTPAPTMARILSALRQGRQVIFETSHVLPTQPSASCAFQLMREFLAQPARALDTSCATAVRPRQYATDLPDWIKERLGH
jgi:pimeloyl-ACP methyl ester carboxylesterase